MPANWYKLFSLQSITPLVLLPAFSLNKISRDTWVMMGKRGLSVLLAGPPRCFWGVVFVPALSFQNTLDSTYESLGTSIPGEAALCHSNPWRKLCVQDFRVREFVRTVGKNWNSLTCSISFIWEEGTNMKFEGVKNKEGSQGAGVA